MAWAVSLLGIVLAWEIAIKALHLPPRTAGGFILVAALGNTGYIGYPVVAALLGRRPLPAAVFYDVFGTVAVLLHARDRVAARYGEHEGRVNAAQELLTFPAVIAWSSLAYGASCRGRPPFRRRSWAGQVCWPTWWRR